LFFNKIIREYQTKYALLVLDQPNNIVTALLNKVLGVFVKLINERKGIPKDLYFWADGCLEAIISEQDKSTREQCDTFWFIWEWLLEWHQTNEKLFIHRLLLDLSWKDTANKWNTIEGKKEFFFEALKLVEPNQISYVVQLASRIGFEEMGVELLPVVVELSKKGDFENVKLKDSELWMQKLFTLKREQIIKKQPLLNDVIYILNQMIKRDSTVAFEIRDVLISYKNA